MHYGLVSPWVYFSTWSWGLYFHFGFSWHRSVSLDQASFGCFFMLVLTLWAVMASSFGAFGCVLGVLSTLITFSQLVIKIVDDVGKVFCEIQHFSRDVRAFFSVVRSLDIALREQDIRDIVESERAIFFTRSTSELSWRPDKLDGQAWKIWTEGGFNGLQEAKVGYFLAPRDHESTLNSALKAMVMYVRVKHDLWSIAKNSRGSLTYANCGTAR